MSFDFAIRYSPWTGQINDLCALCVPLSTHLSGVRSAAIPASGNLGELLLYPSPFQHLFTYLTFIIVYFVPGTVLSDWLETKGSTVRKNSEYYKKYDSRCGK